MATIEQLSDSEIRVLQCLADGESPHEKLDYTEGTTRQKLFLIRQKLDAPTTYNAIATAIRQGLID